MPSPQLMSQSKKINDIYQLSDYLYIYTYIVLTYYANYIVITIDKSLTFILWCSVLDFMLYEIIYIYIYIYICSILFSIMLYFLYYVFTFNLFQWIINTTRVHLQTCTKTHTRELKYLNTWTNTQYPFTYKTLVCK